MRREVDIAVTDVNLRKLRVFRTFVFAIHADVIQESWTIFVCASLTLSSGGGRKDVVFPRKQNFAGRKRRVVLKDYSVFIDKSIMANITFRSRSTLTRM